mgnify:CR=1 FL=1
MSDNILRTMVPRQRSQRWTTCLLAVGLALSAGMVQAGDLSGCWSGTWQSQVTGHHGPLWAQFVRTGDNQYEVSFRGRFFVLVPFRYRVTMTATEQPDGTVQLQGSQYLGRMFGTFTFTATATDHQFQAHYASCKDHGSFCLTRCTIACCAAP